MSIIFIIKTMGIHDKIISFALFSSFAINVDIAIGSPNCAKEINSMKVGESNM